MKTKTKTLLKYEWNQIKPAFYISLIVIGIILAIMIRQTMEMRYLSIDEILLETQWAENYISEYTTYLDRFHGLVEGLTPIFTVMTLLISIVLYSGWHRGSSRRFMNAMPVTDARQKKYKFIVGASALTALWAVFSAITLILRAIVIDDIWEKMLYEKTYASELHADKLSILLAYLGSIWLVMMCVYTIFSLMHLIVNNKVLAPMFGVLLTVTPSMISGGICSYIETKSNNFLFAIELFGGMFEEIDKNEISLVKMLWGDGFDFYDRWYFWLIKYGILIAITALLIVVIFRQKPIDLSKRRPLVSSVLVRILLAIGAGLISGTIICLFFGGISLAFIVDSSIVEYIWKYVILPIFWIGASIGCYFILGIRVRGAQA